MVKKVAPVVRLDWTNPQPVVQDEWIPREQVTVPDLGISLEQMVRTGTVTMTSRASYVFPEVSGDDDEDHRMPDFQRLKTLDIVEKSEFVDEFVNNPLNYVEKNESEETAGAVSKQDVAAKGGQQSAAPAQGAASGQ